MSEALPCCNSALSLRQGVSIGKGKLCAKSIRNALHSRGDQAKEAL